MSKMKQKLTPVILISLIIASIVTLFFYQFGHYHTFTVDLNAGPDHALYKCHPNSTSALKL
ncbi:MAG: hypothetical protein GY787_07740 [Alteromonadales bacterium]|nr:hypothetical protein [Alteromonadales bacterium]